MCFKPFKRMSPPLMISQFKKYKDDTDEWTLRENSLLG